MVLVSSSQMSLRLLLLVSSRSVSPPPSLPLPVAIWCVDITVSVALALSCSFVGGDFRFEDIFLKTKNNIIMYDNKIFCNNMMEIKYFKKSMQAIKGSLKLDFPIFLSEFVNFKNVTGHPIAEIIKKCFLALR